MHTSPCSLIGKPFCPQLRAVQGPAICHHGLHQHVSLETSQLLLLLSSLTAVESEPRILAQGGVAEKRQNWTSLSGSGPSALPSGSRVITVTQSLQNNGLIASGRSLSGRICGMYLSFLSLFMPGPIHLLPIGLFIFFDFHTLILKRRQASHHSPYPPSTGDALPRTPSPVPLGFILRQGSTELLRWILRLWSSYLSLSSHRNVQVCTMVPGPSSAKVSLVICLRA